MSGKMSAFPDSPPANCKTCGKDARVIKYNAFSYWWCDKCKDEVEVWMRCVPTPKGEKFGYYGTTAVGDGDIELREPGVYRIEYVDGTYEFFHRKEPAESRPTLLNGNTVRAAKRLAESNVPSRKPVQCLSEAGAGTPQEEGRLGIWPFSDAPDSPYRTTEDGVPLLLPPDFGQNYSFIFVDSKGTLWEYKNICSRRVGIQYRQVPPDDEL